MAETWQKFLTTWHQLFAQPCIMLAESTNMLMLFLQLAPCPKGEISFPEFPTDAGGPLQLVPLRRPVGQPRREGRGGALRRRRQWTRVLRLSVWRGVRDSEAQNEGAGGWVGGEEVLMGNQIPVQ